MNDGQLNRLPSQRTFVAGRICLSICASCIHPLRLALGLCRMELLSHSKCAFVRCLILIGMEKARLYEPAIPRATSEPFSRNRPSFRPPSVNSKRTAKGFKVGFCLGPTQCRSRQHGFQTSIYGTSTARRKVWIEVSPNRQFALHLLESSLKVWSRAHALCVW